MLLTILVNWMRRSQALKAISFKVNYLHAYNNLGSHKKLGKLNEAENYFRQAIAIKPDFIEGYCNLGNTLKILVDTKS